MTEDAEDDEFEYYFVHDSIGISHVLWTSIGVSH
jgi:hypothetical protein